MAAVIIRVPDALQNGQTPVIQQLAQSLQLRVQAQVVIDPQHVFGGQSQGFAAAAVDIIRIGHDGIQTVIAAGQLQHDQDPLFVALLALGSPRSALEESWHGSREGQDRRSRHDTLQELAASLRHERFSRKSLSSTQLEFWQGHDAHGDFSQLIRSRSDVLLGHRFDQLGFHTG